MKSIGRRIILPSELWSKATYHQLGLWRCLAIPFPLSHGCIPYPHPLRRMGTTNRSIASYTAGCPDVVHLQDLSLVQLLPRIVRGLPSAGPTQHHDGGRGGRHQWRPSNGPCRRCRLPQRCCGAGMAGRMLAEFGRLDASHGIGENSEGGPALPQSSIFYVRRRSFIRWCVSPHVVSWPRILAQVTALATIFSMTLSVYKDRTMVYSAYSYSCISSSSTTSSSAPSPS